MYSKVPSAPSRSLICDNMDNVDLEQGTSSCISQEPPTLTPPGTPENHPTPEAEVSPPSYIECRMDSLLYPKTDEEVRDALVDYYATSCTSSSFINRMNILTITPIHAFRYVLHTAIETRTFEKILEPYKPEEEGMGKGGIGDAPNPIAILPLEYPSELPDRWAIPVTPPDPYADNTLMKIPLVDQVGIIKCLKCVDGMIPCGSCDGLAFTKCNWCKGTHKTRLRDDQSYQTCISCPRSKRVPCKECQGSGQISCSICEGQKMMKQTLVLKVKWTTETQMYDTEREAVSREILKYKAWDAILLDQESLPDDPKPIQLDQVDRQITQVSRKSLEEWIDRQNPYSRVNRFHQKLGIIPIVKVRFDLGLSRDEEMQELYLISGVPFFPDGVPYNFPFVSSCMIM